MCIRGVRTADADPQEFSDPRTDSGRIFLRMLRTWITISQHEMDATHEPSATCVDRLRGGECLITVQRCIDTDIYILLLNKYITVFHTSIGIGIGYWYR